MLNGTKAFSKSILLFEKGKLFRTLRILIKAPKVIYICCFFRKCLIN